MNLEHGASAEGYRDPTASGAMKKPSTRVWHADPETAHLTETIEAVKAMLWACGYEPQNRIILKDRKTGKVWK